MNSSSSASTGSRINEKFGESISPSPNSERQLVNSSPLKRKTQGDCLKELPSLEECTDMVSSPPKNSNSIMCWVWLSTNSSIADSKPELPRMHSTQSLCIKPDALSSRDTSVSERTWWTAPHSWWEPNRRRRSTWLPSPHSKRTSQAEPQRRKTKEKIKESKRKLDSNLIIKKY